MFNPHGSISLHLSPFEYRCKISALHCLKMCLLSVIVLPVRALATGLTFLLALGLANFITPGYSHATLKPQRDLKRRLLMPILILLSRTVYFLGGIHWVTVKGERAPRSLAPIIVLGPHSSFLDSLAVVVMGMPSCVATVGHANSFIGGVIRVLQPILVNREDRHSREKTVSAICLRANSREDWPQLLIFPEGTCTNRTCLVSFRLGAFQPGLPVQPVLLRWPNRTDTSTWVWKGPSVWKLLWMTFSQFTTRFEIEFLPVYNPNPEERMDPRLYANNVRSKMAEALNIPTCDLLYDDFCRFQIANECGLPDPEGMVYLHALLRTAFSFERFEDPRQCENASYRDWVHVRLEKLLSIARHMGYLSQLAFIDAIFPNVQPNERETFLLNKAVQHYAIESSTGVDFRMFITRACLFLFASDLRTAIRYAVMAFPPKEPHFPNSPTEPLAMSGSYDLVQTWAIRHSDAKQLILYLFNARQQGTDILELINLSVECFDQDTRTSDINESVPVHPDRLYAALNAVSLPFPRSYLQFETLLSKTLGKRGRPLLHFDGTITSDLRPSKYSFNTSELASYRRSTSAGTCNSDASTEPCVTNSSDKSRKLLPYAVSPSNPPLVDSNNNQTCAAAYRRTLPSPPFSNKLGNT